MRFNLSVCLSGLCALGLGCTGLLETSTGNLLFEARLCKENFQQHLRNRALADSAWDQFLKANPGEAYSRDFAIGFKQGFTDYLEAGGTGNPPPAPPSSYWNSHYQTSEGYSAIEDWFAGFRQGASLAQEGGDRNWIYTSSLHPAVNALQPQSSGGCTRSGIRRSGSITHAQGFGGLACPR